MTKARTCPVDINTQSFCNNLATHFQTKEATLHAKIERNRKRDPARVLRSPPPQQRALLREFKTLSADDYYLFMARNKSAGCKEDPAPQDIFRKLLCEPAIAPAARRIINYSLQHGIMPPCLKSGLITPLIKKPNLDPEDLNNYRGLTNGGLLGKIIEKIATEQLDGHVEVNGILDGAQAGFRKGHSTETVIVAAWDDIKRQADAGGAAAIILLDLSAAFDTVDHTLLLDKLEIAGVSGTAKAWIASFLKDRTSKVATKNYSSETYTQRFGVPQGSPLSPLLFNIYTSHLPSLIRMHNLACYNYADDTQIVMEISNSGGQNPERINDCILDIMKWMSTNHLLLNPDKTELLTCGKDHLIPRPFPWPQDLGEAPTPAIVLNNLGSLMSSSLKPIEFAKKNAANCFRLLRSIRRVLPLLSFPQQVSAVISLILSRLDYANAVFAGASKKCTDILQRPQNAAARILLKLAPRESITPALKALHWLPISRRVTFKILVLTFKCRSKTAPAFLQSRIQDRPNPRPLRCSDAPLLFVPRSKSKFLGEATFSVQGPRLWNSLPRKIRDCSSLPVFKKELKAWLFISEADRLAQH